MDDKYKGEEVLVFHTRLLEELGHFNGSKADWQRYLGPVLENKNNHFHKRFQAETDDSLKQIIPYILFKWEDQLFSYVRGKRAGEQRLLGNRSVGIGGHVNPIDAQVGAETMETYLEAVRREINEEVRVEGPINPKIVAVLNDDRNPVGRVHFGVIHLVELEGPRVTRKEQQITASGFFNIKELATTRRNELESWSQIAVDYLLNGESEVQ